MASAASSGVMRLCAAPVGQVPVAPPPLGGDGQVGDLGRVQGDGLHPEAESRVRPLRTMGDCRGGGGGSE